MAKTAAERQAEYRARRDFAGEDKNGDKRINTWVSTRTALGLRRLANRYGVTQREMLERLIKAEEDAILKTMELDSQEWEAYFD